MAPDHGFPKTQTRNFRYNVIIECNKIVFPADFENLAIILIRSSNMTASECLTLSVKVFKK